MIAVKKILNLMNTTRFRTSFGLKVINGDVRKFEDFLKQHMSERVL